MKCQTIYNFCLVRLILFSSSKHFTPGTCCTRLCWIHSVSLFDCRFFSQIIYKCNNTTSCLVMPFSNNLYSMPEMKLIFSFWKRANGRDGRFNRHQRAASFFLAKWNIFTKRDSNNKAALILPLDSDLSSETFRGNGIIQSYIICPITRLKALIIVTIIQNNSGMWGSVYSYRDASIYFLTK